MGLMREWVVDGMRGCCGMVLKEPLPCYRHTANIREHLPLTQHPTRVGIQLKTITGGLPFLFQHPGPPNKTESITKKIRHM